MMFDYLIQFPSPNHVVAPYRAEIKYGSRNVLADEGIREGVKQFTGWPTIPQVMLTLATA